jgi:DNA-binding Lrp family transcriptional regulator
MSKRVGVSDRTVARRIKRMEEKGIIKGYKIELSEEVVEKFFPSNKMPLEHTVEMPAVCWDSIIDAIVGTFGVGGVLIIYNIGLSIGRTYGTLLKRFSDEREILLSNFCNLFKSLKL